MTRQQEDAFIAKIAPLARTSAARFGIPASVTAAQAILESGWGQSRLATECNNFFGIKARAKGNDPYQVFQTTEFINGKAKKVPEKFQKFPDLQACFDRHAELLTTQARFAPAMRAAADPDQYIFQLQICGYATDPNYPQELARIIARCGLSRMDEKEGAA